MSDEDFAPWLCTDNAPASPSSPYYAGYGADAGVLGEIFTRHTSPRPIIGRPPTPAPFRDMNPLQRWRNSPPEDEPAPLDAIASALRSRGRPASSYTGPNFDIHFSTGPSRGPSSHSSSNASCSLASSSSSHWHAGSDHSGSFGSSSQVGTRRRRRHPKKRWRQVTRLSNKPRPFQCTFCTDTFKAKYDWERHEKSLHLSLERWLCSRDGPTAVTGDDKRCVYCGQPSPDDEHLHSHNYLACMHRPVEERTFYRKDHLQQHLRLVHLAKFSKGTMETWNAQTFDVKSRCGFCDTGLSSWRQRADHLAGHFREGTTMASWQGDWGLEANVVPMVENAIPPYLIDLERSSPYPFSPNRETPTTPSSAYELLETEINYYVLRYYEEHSHVPSYEEVQYESCCVIFGSEISTGRLAHYDSSWLRDLLVDESPAALRARTAPFRNMLSSRVTQLRINGKKHIFEECSLEQQLSAFVELVTGADAGRRLTAASLQAEACSIIDGQKGPGADDSGVFPAFLKGIARGSSTWLGRFATRVGITLIYGPQILYQREVSGQRGDLALSDSVNGTHYGQLLQNFPLTAAADEKDAQGIELSLDTFKAFQSESGTILDPKRVSSTGLDLDMRFHQQHGAPFFLAGNNGYERLFFELSRFVTKSISPNNPAPHVPSDLELQFQARWILYDDDDPLNQTPADNPTWLLQFKQKVGIDPHLG